MRLKLSSAPLRFFKIILWIVIYFLYKISKFIHLFIFVIVRYIFFLSFFLSFLKSTHNEVDLILDLIAFRGPTPSTKKWHVSWQKLYFGLKMQKFSIQILNGVHPRSVILGVMNLFFPGNKQTNKKTFYTKTTTNITSSISMQLQITDRKKITCIHAIIVH